MSTAFALVCLAPGKVGTARAAVAASCLPVGSVKELSWQEQSAVTLASRFKLKCVSFDSQQKSGDVLQGGS